MAGLQKGIFQNSEFKPFQWLRYPEELFLYGANSQKLTRLFNCITSLHSTIKFTMDYSITRIDFLGVHVTKVDNKLETDLYCKPNDTHKYLHAQSCTLQCHLNVY